MDIIAGIEKINERLCYLFGKHNAPPPKKKNQQTNKQNKTNKPVTTLMDSQDML